MKSWSVRWIGFDRGRAVSSTTTQEDFPRLKVYLLLLVGLTAIGISPLLVRYATDVEPMTLAAMRALFAILILLPFWLVKRKSMAELKASGVNAPMMMVAGFCLGLHLTFWIASLHYTSVASASVLVSIHPVMLIVAESLIFRKRFKPMVWAGVLVAFAGTVLLGITDQVQESEFVNATLGNILAFVAAVIFVFYFLIGRKIRQRAEWIDYVFHVYFHAAVICVILTFVWSGGWPFISATAVLIGLALAAGPMIMGHGSMNYAVKYISPTLLSTLVLTEVVLAAIGAWILFQEVPGTLSILAMVVIMAGVVLSWVRKRPAETLDE
ncbi:MAG: DMT family transporter [Balneolaceae bacterium]